MYTSKQNFFHPTISIIMAVYNENPSYLKQSITSILNQTYANFEFIIINDSSNKQTTSLLQQYAKKNSKIILIQNKRNIGLTKSLNIGIKKSTGQYIARMDSDDISLPNRLSSQLRFLTKNNLDLIGSNCDIINSQGDIIKKRREPIARNYRKEMFKHSLFAHSTFFGRRQIFKEYYNEKFKTAQDYEFLLRILGKNYKIKHLPSSLLLYRLNQNGISIKKIKKQDLSALRARITSIFKYNYPLYYCIYLLKPIILLLTPLFIQHFILYKNQK